MSEYTDTRLRDLRLTVVEFAARPSEQRFKDPVSCGNYMWVKRMIGELELGGRYLDYDKLVVRALYRYATQMGVKVKIRRHGLQILVWRVR